MGRASTLRVGRTPPSAPDPLVRLFKSQRPTGASAAVQGDRPTTNAGRFRQPKRIL